MGINIIKRQWFERGFSCDVWIDKPGACWENFSHDVDELVMVIQGEVEFEVSGEIFHPTIGEELLIPAKALHSVRNIGTMESRWLYGYATSIPD